MKRTAEIFLAVVVLVVALLEGRLLLASSLGRRAEARGQYDAALAYYRVSERSFFTRDLFLSEATIFLKQKKLDAAQTALDHYSAVNKEDERAWRLRGDVAQAQGKGDEALNDYRKAYELGRYNDIGVLAGFVSALKTAGKTSEIAVRKNEFDALLHDFADAIAHDTHFIALSPNVEKFASLSALFAGLFPAEKQRYLDAGKRATGHAAEERARISSRPVGLLW